ncbi:hypothetical protein N7495_008432 [Penicillium taxi]|uniref:uncharacterized protein n=1 Tax=Penicillium taxi TaxID=168475 RepID=UPI0025452C44|nr:uncharacterized protein N7495_008432 [Penicillium taxi]KAJ5888391.1 hypothetical protein N7495_008432 [Penicillium taxi]
MAPIRRYLRISKYSVLECRIYLENPSDTRWLLDPRDPILPRVFAAIRPLVLPKLREENERMFAKKKSKAVKDVIVEDEFEVGIFLRESRTRHSLLTRQKSFDKSYKSKDPGELNVGIEPGNPNNAHIIIGSDSDNDPDFDMGDIPHAEDDSGAEESLSRRKKLVKTNTAEEAGDEKKMGFETHYESFNIWGWVLCLIISRKGDKPRATSVGTAALVQPLMEEWISTQVQTGIDED